MTIKLGIIGAGRIGRLHAENVATRVPHAHPVAITDVIPSHAREVAEQYAIPTVAEDYQQILADPEITAVLICSSTDTHAQIIEDAARAGKHVFCEKPIDLDLARIKQALKVVDDSGVKLQIGFNRRFDYNFAKLHALIRAGDIGDLHILRITSRDPAPPPLAYVKTSGGLFLDMTIHDFDMARFLTGSEVTEVYAVGDAIIDPQVKQAGDIDTAVVLLKFENGIIGTIDNSRKAVYGYDQRVEAFGALGMAQAHNASKDDVVISTEAGVVSGKPKYFFLERYRESFVAELRAFVDAIQTDKTPPITGADSLAPLRMGLAAQKSLLENRPVRLDEIPA